MNFDDMCLLDHVTQDGAECGSMVLTTKRGHAMYLLRLPDRGEEGYHLYAIPMWPEAEAAALRKINEVCDEDGETEDGDSFIDIFWNEMERYYVGEFE